MNSPARLELVTEGRTRARADLPRPIEPVPVRLQRAGRTKPLACPYCRQRSARPLGGRTYQCFNSDCPGGPEQLFQFSSVLIVDAARGARLVAWHEARRLNEERLRDPLAALRRRD